MRKVGRVTPCAPPPANPRVRVHRNGARGATRPTSLRQEFRDWRASLPTPLERDTLLWPEVIAETVVQEAGRFLETDLPADYAARLAAKAHLCYARSRHFHKLLRRADGRDTLYMFMRHWTASWLKRERYALYKKLPWEYARGRRLPLTAPVMPRNHRDTKRLATEDWIRRS